MSMAKGAGHLTYGEGGRRRCGWFQFLETDLIQNKLYICTDLKLLNWHKNLNTELSLDKNSCQTRWLQMVVFGAAVKQKLIIHVD